MRYLLILAFVFTANLSWSQNELSKLMVGSFSSSEQALNDSGYYDITLHMYPIWPNETDVYLYVEQAVTAMPERPYRQRVYHVTQTSDGGYASAVYKLPHDSLYIGKWKEPEFFNSITPKDLIERQGCTVYMQKVEEGVFKGSTRKDECKSTLRGAAYATSKVEVRKGVVTSWDQGFDTEGNQVWGAIEGPYIFKDSKQ